MDPYRTAVLCCVSQFIPGSSSQSSSLDGCPEIVVEFPLFSSLFTLFQSLMQRMLFGARFTFWSMRSLPFPKLRDLRIPKDLPDRNRGSSSATVVGWSGSTFKSRVPSKNPTVSCQQEKAVLIICWCFCGVLIARIGSTKLLTDEHPKD